MDCSPPGSSVRGIFQERILEWVAISYTRDLPDPGIELACFASPALAGGFFTVPPEKPYILYKSPLKKGFEMKLELLLHHEKSALSAHMLSRFSCV